MNKRLKKVLTLLFNLVAFPIAIVAGAVSLFCFLVDDAIAMNERKKQLKKTGHWKRKVD